MKTAVMTWFAYRNYGTALQAVALCHAVKMLGHEAVVIDYAPRSRAPRDIEKYDIFSVIKRKIDPPRKEVIPMEYLPEKKEKAFSDFLSEHITLTEKCVTESDLNFLCEKYGAFICGSDQIWSPRCFDRNYFLSFVPDPERMIAYAPSMGLPAIPDSRIGREITALASRFKHLTVREKSAADSLSKLTGKECKYACDPTLLLSANDWERLCGIENRNEKNYVLFYQLGTNKTHIDSAIKYAEKLGMPLNIVPVREGDNEKEGCLNDGIGPKEFLSLIKNAHTFITDSFHGMIFSLLFGTSLVPLERFRSDDPSSQNARVYGLLDAFGVGSALVGYECGELSAVSLGASEAERVRKALSDSSLAFLKGALESVEKHLTEKRLKAVTRVNTLCCGCGACETVCPTGAVQVGMNTDGFYNASLDESKCISCGKCVSICPYCLENGGKRVTDSPLFSYKSFNEETISTSSSGGFAHDLSALLIKDGYTVIGCAFDEKTQRAKHILVESEEKLSLLRGSKYMQSELGPALIEAKKTDGKLAFFGTPCQIAAAKKVFNGRDDVLYVDLICHGVPSYNLYGKYTRFLNKKYRLRRDRITTVFRDKSRGWRTRFLSSTDGKRSVTIGMKDDPYFSIFDTCVAQMDACYECRFRMTSEADIRIGDYWGKKFSCDNTGVSMVSVFTEKGEKMLEMLSEHGLGEIVLQPVQDYFVQQTDNFPRPLFHSEIMTDLKTKKNDIALLRLKYSFPFEYRRESRAERHKRVFLLMMAETFGRRGKNK